MLRFEHVHLAVQGRGRGRDVALLRDIDFALTPGKTLGIVGESGAGKSTIGRLVMGLLPDGFALTGGRIFLGPQELTTMPARQRQALRGRRLAFIPQEPLTALNPLLTIGQSFAEQLEVIGHPKTGHGRVTPLIQDALAALQLPDPPALMRRYPHQLSGGQCQRVLIAMAFAGQPQLMIADEPTTALDVMSQAHVMRLLLQQQKKHGTAVMLITHDLLMAAHVCDELLVLHAGAIVESGTAADILTRPRHPYTQTLLAAVPRLATAAQDASASVAAVASAAPAVPPAAPPAVPLLTVRHLTLRYPAPGRGPCGWLGEKLGLRRSLTTRANPAIAALRDISFDVYAGECVGIVGESGSGKSSLARALMGMHPQCSGSMVLDGVPVLEARSKATMSSQHRNRHAAQIIFQDPHSALNPRRTVRRLLTQGAEARPRGVSPNPNPNPNPQQGTARDTHLQTLLHAIGLSTDLLERYPAQLSGGQKQRVNIGRGLFLTPKLLLADEIVSGLDVTVQAQILRLLKDLVAQQGIAIVLIAHDLAVVRQICQRVIVLYQGQVVEQGRVDEVFAHPAHDYTRRLLAAVPGGDPQNQVWPPMLAED